MEVILRSCQFGFKGDLQCKDGYGRNYLIPQKLAVFYNRQDVG